MHTSIRAGILTLGVTAVTIGGGWAAARTGAGDTPGDDSARRASVVVPSSPTTAPSNGIDISGNCDEAEHFADPECAGGGRSDDDRSDDDRSDDDRSDDDHHGGRDAGSDDHGNDGRGGSNDD